MTILPLDWLDALNAALVARGDAPIDLSRLTQRDVDDLIAQHRMNRSPEDTADVLTGKRPVPRPWVQADDGGDDEMQGAPV